MLSLNLGFLISGVFSWTASAQAPPIQKIVTDYFKSLSVQFFRLTWGFHKIPIENAIQLAISTSNFTKLDRDINEKLAVAYVIEDRQVKVIFKDFEQISLPLCKEPVVQFLPTSNILTIKTTLDTMSVSGNYSLLRNRDDILFQTNITDPIKNSVFQLVHVDESGKLAFWLKDCTLSGFYIITMLNRDSIKLGYDYFNLSNCIYNIQINNFNSNESVFDYDNLDGEDDAGSVLSVSGLMLMPLLIEELTALVETAMLSFVNASTIFDSMKTKFHIYRNKQKMLFLATAHYMSELIRSLNNNQSEINMEEYTFLWDEDQKHMDQPETVVQLTEMVLRGLNSMYSAQRGGPFKMDKVMIAEEIRFSSLQVRGSVYVTSERLYNVSVESFVFATEIIDLVVAVHLEEDHWDKPLIKVKGLRRMAFALSTIKPVFVEHLVGGYLLNEVPKLVHAYLTTILPEALQPNNT
ncbi:hypothetical protein PYW08_004600 [Mythimna loreyi]|uniref:Uncharacterized protein n=1 Tax=Mythimna loreyi TaxID=667449 RepID=A0ACC2QPX2_9NEOP|nr:hypothetical protein PYW08_004600 [Mythimna loreyi]